MGGKHGPSSTPNIIEQVSEEIGGDQIVDDSSVDVMGSDERCYQLMVDTSQGIIEESSSEFMEYEFIEKRMVDDESVNESELCISCAHVTVFQTLCKHD